MAQQAWDFPTPGSPNATMLAALSANSPGASSRIWEVSFLVEEFKITPQLHWSFSESSVTRMLAAFPPGASTVELHGNVLAATALLHGFAHEELRAAELDAVDPDYQVIVTARAVKPALA